MCFTLLFKPLYFRQYFRNKALSASARINTHNQHQITYGQKILHHLNRRAGINCNAGLHARAAYCLKRSVRMCIGLCMERKIVCARLGKLVYICFRMLHHYMHIYRQLCIRAYGGAHGRPKRYRGHERAVHYVEMHKVCIPFAKLSCGSSHVRKIGREQAGGDLNHICVSSFLSIHQVL